MLADWCRTYHVLFVLPDAQRSYSTDMAHGQKYFTYLTQDLPRIVRDVFRVSTAPEDSYIMGASMGGYGALKAALTYPENYAACVAFSPACLDMQRYMTAEWREGRDMDAFRRAFGERIAHDFTAAGIAGIHPHTFGFTLLQFYRSFITIHSAQKHMKKGLFPFLQCTADFLKLIAGKPCFL